MSRPALLLALFAIAPVSAEEISFSRHIAPLLVEQCLECHRADKVKGGYRLDTWRQLQRAGDSGAPPVTPGEPARSELYRLMVTENEDDRMPKKADALPAEQAVRIRDWIVAGARFDGGESSLDLPLTALIPESDDDAKAPERYPHPLPVTALAPHSGGALLAVGGYREITLWNPEQRALKKRIGGLPERVLALEWLPDAEGKRMLLAAGGVPGRSGGLWLVEEDNPPRRLLQTRDCMMALVVSPDGSRAVTAGADQAVRCVAVPSGEVLWSVEAHADWVLDLALSPDGKRVATASRDRSARLINLASGEIDATFTAHAVAVTSVLFAADGKTVFSGDAGGEIRRWNDEGEAIKDSTLRAGRSEVAALQRAGSLVLAGMADGRLLPLQPEERKALEPLARAEERWETLRVIPGEDGGWRVFAGAHDGRVWRLAMPPESTQAERKDVKPDGESAPIENEPAQPVPPLHFTASPGWSGS